MKKGKKLLIAAAGGLAALYAGLFAVFYFDLDGKLLYHVVEPFLCRHYDRIERGTSPRRPTTWTNTANTSTAPNDPRPPEHRGAFPRHMAGCNVSEILIFSPAVAY